MSLSDFTSNSIWINLLLLAVAGAVVWAAGTRVTRIADEISRRTGLGKAFAGLLLLGTVTSLPEIATTATAATLGDAGLISSNLYGGIAAQTCIIAVADLVSGKQALTHRMQASVLIMQATFLALLMITAAAAWAYGERLSVWNVGLGTVLVFAAFLACLKTSHAYEKHEAWRPSDRSESPGDQDRAAALERGHSDPRLYGTFAAFAAAIVGAGWLLTRSADALATQTGSGSSLIGATVVAMTTSLPEVSVTVSAVRIGSYSMAVSNVLGGNLFDAALIFPADILYRKGPILRELPGETLFLLLVACVMVLIYVWGMLERRNRTVLRMGIDSVLVLLCYGVGIGGLYLLQSK